MKTQWLENKRRFLTDFFLSNKKVVPDYLLPKSKDSKPFNQNINLATSSSWQSLIEASKNAHCLIAQAPVDLYSCGLKCDNQTCQNILEYSFEKKLQELIYDYDIMDEDALRENIIEYIYMNRLQHKSFSNLIKKIRLIDIDMLPNTM